MKSASGQPVSRVRIYQRSIERRDPRFGERQLSAAEMKALNLRGAGLDQTPAEEEWSEQRRRELLAASPMGAKMLQDEKRK
jgi:hypothetical protein